MYKRKVILSCLESFPQFRTFDFFPASITFISMARHELTNFHRTLLIIVLHVVRRPIRALLIAASILMLCIAAAVWKLEISTDQDQLFSRDVPFFRDYVDFTKNFPENQANYVVIESRDPNVMPPVKRWTALADTITTRLQQEKEFVESAASHVQIAELGSQAMLFDDPKNLPQNVADANRLLPLAKLWGEAPTLLTGLLGSSPIERFINGVGLQPIDKDTNDFLHMVVDGWNAALADPNRPVTLGDQVPNLEELGATDPSQLGYFYVKNDKDPTKHLMLVRVFEKTNYTSMGGLSESIDGIRNAMNEEAKKFPEFTVALTGRPALEADEMVTTDRDSRKSEICALTAVFVGLVVLFRSIWLAIAAEISLLVGIGWTFGWAALTIGSLNLLSMVFLIALIGIGMDYLIQVLTRYRRESAVHGDPRVIWAAVFKHVAAPINTACLGASGAFFVSVFTDFRGAAELGIIASGGLLLCLITGYVVLPALLTLFPVKPISVEEARFGEHPTQSDGSHHWWLSLPSLWAVLILIGVPFALRARFDPSLLNMQAKDLESVQQVRKLQTWFGVVLSKDLNLLRQVNNAVKDLPSVAGTESILPAYENYQWFLDHAKELPTVKWAEPQPVTEAALPKIAAAAKTLAKKVSDPATAESLNKFADQLRNKSAADRLTQWQHVFIDELKTLIGRFHPDPIDVNKIPGAQRDHLIGLDGRFALYINPKKDLWVQKDLGDFVHQVDDAVAKVPGAPVPTGIAIQVYKSTSSIEKSFYHATFYALGLIFILVLVDLRNFSQTLLAISVLAMGLPMLVALMGLMHVNWNFANFFGLPILIGAGHEYGVFMVHRYNEARRDPRRAWVGWDVSDRALLLCAFVTSASFGFFWALAHHQGLKSLGLVMSLGTLCIYLATLCMLRPMLLWRLAHQRHLESKNPNSVESTTLE